MLQTLAPIPDSELGGEKTKNRITRRLERSLRIMDNARNAPGRLATAGPKKARNLINAVIRDLERGIANGKIDPETGNELLALVRSVLQNLQPLTKRR